MHKSFAFFVRCMTIQSVLLCCRDSDVKILVGYLWKVHVECDLSKVKRSKRAMERLGDHLSRAQFIELTHHGDML
jgi:hypothetical protein